MEEKLDNLKLPQTNAKFQIDFPLKEKALKFVGALNEFISNEQYKFSHLITENEMGEEGQNDNRVHQHASEWMKTYSQEFKIEAISLKSELKKSLNSYSSIENVSEQTYKRPVNFFALEDIANELQQLALSLDDSS